MNKTTILLAIAAALLGGNASASEFTATLGHPLTESVLYQFDDTIDFTPVDSGTYLFNYTVKNVNAGCSTRFCHSKWSIHTQVTSFYLTDGVNLWVPPYGGVTAPLLAGVTYSLHIAGVGYGTGFYAGQGAYTVTVTKGY